MGEHIIMLCSEGERLHYNVCSLEAPRDHRHYITMWTCGFCEVHYKRSTSTVAISTTLSTTPAMISTASSPVTSIGTLLRPSDDGALVINITIPIIVIDQNIGIIAPPLAPPNVQSIDHF